MLPGRFYGALAVAGAALLAGSAPLGGGSAAAVRQAAADALAAIRDRSPGERTIALLIKNPRQWAPDRSARALPRVRAPKPKLAPAPESEAAPAALERDLADALGLPPMLAATAPPSFEEFAPGGPLAPPLGGGGGSVWSGGGGGGGGGGIGGGGGGGGGDSGRTGPVDTIPVPPSVPEPSTWLNLILGFVTLGWALRRKRARREAHG